MKKVDGNWMVDFKKDTGMEGMDMDMEGMEMEEPMMEEPMMEEPIIETVDENGNPM